MKRLAAILPLAAGAASAQCVMCFRTAAAQQMERARVLNFGIIVMLTALLGLSVVKAALIIAYFMHLKFERFSLFLTLFPMLIFCICMMFVFMPDSMRAMLMRTN